MTVNLWCFLPAFAFLAYLLCCSSKVPPLQGCTQMSFFPVIIMLVVCSSEFSYWISQSVQMCASNNGSYKGLIGAESLNKKRVFGLVSRPRNRINKCAAWICFWQKVFFLVFFYCDTLLNGKATFHLDYNSVYYARWHDMHKIQNSALVYYKEYHIQYITLIFQRTTLVVNKFFAWLQGAAM